MHTLSGRRFEIGTKFAPKISDVAVSLARLPRWGGATVKGKDWTVLHHSVAAGALAKHMPPPVRLYALLHDMEEMATGDIPKPFKSAQQSELGRRLQEWLYRETVKQPFPTQATIDYVHVIDEHLKFAELVSFCHPNSWWDPYFRPELEAFVEADKPDPVIMDAIDAVWSIADTPEQQLIAGFTTQVAELLDTKQLKALRDTI